MLQASAAAGHARIDVHADIAIADHRRTFGAVALRLRHAEIRFVKARAQREILADDGEVIELGERHDSASTVSRMSRGLSVRQTGTAMLECRKLEMGGSLAHPYGISARLALHGCARAQRRQAGE